MGHCGAVSWFLFLLSLFTVDIKDSVLADRAVDASVFLAQEALLKFRGEFNDICVHQPKY